MTKTRKRARKQSKYLYLGLILLSAFFVSCAINNIMIYADLKTQIRANTALLDQRKLEQEELETERKNLTNPDYLEFMARGKYHVSREGEQVFVFPVLSLIVSL